MATKVDCFEKSPVNPQEICEYFMGIVRKRTHDASKSIEAISDMLSCLSRSELRSYILRQTKLIDYWLGRTYNMYSDGSRERLYNADGILSRNNISVNEFKKAISLIAHAAIWNRYSSVDIKMETTLYKTIEQFARKAIKNGYKLKE